MMMSDGVANSHAAAEKRDSAPEQQQQPPAPETPAGADTEIDATDLGIAIKQLEVSEKRFWVRSRLLFRTAETRNIAVETVHKLSSCPKALTHLRLIMLVLPVLKRRSVVHVPGHLPLITHTEGVGGTDNRANQASERPDSVCKSHQLMEPNKSLLSVWLSRHCLTRYGLKGFNPARITSPQVGLKNGKCQVLRGGCLQQIERTSEVRRAMLLEHLREA